MRIKTNEWKAGATLIPKHQLKKEAEGKKKKLVNQK